jgi:twinkle protein
MGYGTATDERGRLVQVANYRNQSGQLVAQKVRTSDKKFTILGDAKEMGLFAAHLWKEGGRRVVVCEGELDALSVAQTTNCSWPVVSIPNGAQSARKALSKSLSFLESFESVVLLFDMDEAGREAAADCAPLFSPGKVSIAEIPFKDASEMLQAGEGSALGKALWQARVWRPGGIVNGADLWDRIIEQQQPGIEYPWAKLQKLTYGQRKGTLVTWTAGSGVGKSTILSQVAYDLAFRHGLKVGYVALEESVGHAAQRFLSQHMGKLCHLPGQATEAEMKAAFDATLASGRIWLFDHFGSADSDTLLSKLRYLAVACECDALVLDHLSIAISGMGVEGDERRVIDYTMTALRTLVEETGVLLHVISHLRRAPNDVKSAEEGGRVTLSMLRGSHSIAQLSDQVIAVERDLQGQDGRMKLRLLKNRLSGGAGPAGMLVYDKETGKLSEVDETLAFEDESEALPF